MIEARELYIFNTVGTDQNYKMKKIGILLEDMDNVTLDGNGSLFMFHGKMTTFASIDCENVEFKNFAVDFQVPTVVDATVESVEGNTAVLYVPECYNYEINGTTITWQVSDAKTGIGSHAPSTIIYDIEGKGFTTFISDIGVDREITKKDEASIIFKVYLDDQTEPAFTSAEMSGNTTKASTGEISLEGVKKLKLVMDQGA